MGKWFKSGTPWIWMTGGAVSLSLIAVIGLFILIGWRGLSFFWPNSVYEFDMLDAQGKHFTVIGEIYDTETVLKEQLIEAGITGLEDEADILERYLIKVGNQLKTVQGSYDSSMKKLTGRGNLIKKVEVIKELGAKTSKNINKNLLDRAHEEI